MIQQLTTLNDEQCEARDMFGIGLTLICIKLVWLDFFIHINVFFSCCETLTKSFFPPSNKRHPAYAISTVPAYCHFPSSRGIVLVPILIILGFFSQPAVRYIFVCAFSWVCLRVCMCVRMCKLLHTVWIKGGWDTSPCVQSLWAEACFSFVSPQINDSTPAHGVLSPWNRGTQILCVCAGVRMYNYPFTPAGGHTQEQNWHMQM